MKTKRRIRISQRDRILADSIASDPDARELSDNEKKLLHSYAKEHVNTALFPEYDEKPKGRRRR